MAHARKQLREAAVALFTGLSGTADRVWANRAQAVKKDSDRFIVVRTPREESEDISQDGTQARVITLTVTIAGKGKDDELADALDDSAALVEEAAAADPTFGGMAQTYDYRGAELALDGSGEKTAGTLMLTFAVVVYTDRADPQTAL